MLTIILSKKISRSRLPGSKIGLGGAMFVQGTLVINDSTITENLSSGSGGGILQSSGSLTIRRSTLSGNISQGAGGGSAISVESVGRMFVEDSTITGNSSSGNGGAIIIYGTATILRSVLSENQGGGSGGGIYNYGGTLRMSDSLVFKIIPLLAAAESMPEDVKSQIRRSSGILG